MLRGVVLCVLVLRFERERKKERERVCLEQLTVCFSVAASLGYIVAIHYLPLT